ncbi:MAG: hypothetical protein CM1200mP26_29310 [Acidimicrobiales bacterium]|nr:MAG: hypothetical protein CM1200mP26_29310 [Acidimicrobiales bacterium]
MAHGRGLRPGGLGTTNWSDHPPCPDEAARRLAGTPHRVDDDQTQISGVAPTPTVHLVERAPNNPVQTPDLDSFQPPAARSGENPARHKTSSTSRFPRPANLPWSNNRALSGCLPPARGLRNPVLVEGPSVGAENRQVGFKLCSTQPTGIIDPEAPAAAKLQTEPFPYRIGPSPSPFQTFDGCLAIHQQPSGHPKSEPEGRTARLQ